jgi:L-aminopeptidase/D-esterase-like protein
VLTDARLDKRAAWLVARAGSAGVARAVAPSATAADGDLVVCAATGEIDADPFVLSALAPEVIAAAIRDAVAQATGAPGCPAAAER